MFKKFILLITILLFSFIVFAADVATADEVVEDPDEAGAQMPNEDVIDEAPAEIIEIVEGAGTILSAGISYRKSPDSNSTILRKSTQREKVLIIGETGDWLKVRMYNNRTAYVKREFVSTEKIFKDESVTTNLMNKKALIDVQDLIYRFNLTLRQSPFALKYQIVPSLELADARKTTRGKVLMTIVLIYSCVDLNGNMLPSFKQNQLDKDMKKLLELIFIKLLLTKTPNYQIIIRTPTFTEDGSVKDTLHTYNTIDMVYSNVDMDMLKEDSSNIWNYVDMTLDMERFFVMFPSVE